MFKSLFTTKTTSKIAILSQLKITQSEKKYLTKQFNDTLKVIEKLNKIYTDRTKETSQITGLVNVFREDAIEETRLLSQKEALSNAKRIYKGFFVIKAIFNGR